MNQLVRTFLLFCSLLMGLVAIVPAQTVDVTKVLADPKTYTFSDNKHTVKTYIYETLEAQTNCCGPARMYLEVKIDPSGYVLNVKPLTGLDQDCYAKSVQDIVKNIKWNAKGFTAAKSIYFEIKPSIDCGEGRANAYAQVGIFNNEKVDANGVPLNYASSTGISASKAAGTTGTPDVSGGIADAGTTPAASTDEAKSGLPTPPGTKPAPTTTTPSGNTPVATGIPDKTRSSANAEMKTALEMAKADREKQEAEIQKLKDQLAAKDAAEAAAKEAEAEAERRAQEEKEREAMAKREERRREEDRIRKEREDERERLARERRSGDRDNGRSGGGFERQDYSDRGRDRYADRGDRDGEPPTREMTAVERAQKELDDAKRAADDAKRAAQDAERLARDQQRDKDRRNTEIIRAEQKRLEAEANLAEAREREQQEKLQQEIRKADEEQREKERLVQEQMRNMERIKSDLERSVADLERLEEAKKQKEQEKMLKDQEFEKAKAQREAETQAAIDKLKLENGQVDPGMTAPGLENAFTGNEQLEILRQQILILTQQINDMRGGGSNSAYAGPGNSRGASPSTTRSRSGAPASKFKSLANNKQWSSMKGMDDILDPNRKEEYPQEVFNVVEEPLPNQGGGEVMMDPSGAMHTNIPGPKFTKPVYAGGATAMKQFIADELKKASVCGLAHAAYEVTIDGSGKVLAHNILSVNNQNLLLYLPSIVQRLQFQPTGSGLPVRAVYEIKAEITCEGVEKVDLNSVPTLLRN